MRNTLTRPSVTLLIATITAALTVLGINTANAAALNFDTGHTDIFNVTAENSQLTLNLKEDITGQHVTRAPGEVTLVVKEGAYQSATAQVGEIASAGYLLPLTQDPELLWPGWDTMGVANDGFNAIDINFLNVSGPGKVHLFTQGAFGGLAPLLSDGYELKTGSVIV